VKELFQGFKTFGISEVEPYGSVTSVKLIISCWRYQIRLLLCPSGQTRPGCVITTAWRQSSWNNLAVSLNAVSTAEFLLGKLTVDISGCHGGEKAYTMPDRFILSLHTFHEWSTHRTDDGGRKCSWNVCKLLPDYTA